MSNYTYIRVRCKIRRIFAVVDAWSIETISTTVLGAVWQRDMHFCGRVVEIF